MPLTSSKLGLSGNGAPVTSESARWQVTVLPSSRTSPTTAASVKKKPSALAMRKKITGNLLGKTDRKSSWIRCRREATVLAASINTTKRTSSSGPAKATKSFILLFGITGHGTRTERRVK